jgi:hypothetical protein
MVASGRAGVRRFKWLRSKRDSEMYRQCDMKRQASQWTLQGTVWNQHALVRHTLSVSEQVLMDRGLDKRG